MSRKRLEKRKKDHSTFIEILWSFIIIMSSGKNGYYIMPPMPPIPGAPIGISGLSSFFSTITHSVVRNIPAIEAAFSKATRATFAGSTTPACKLCGYWKVYGDVDHAKRCFAAFDRCRDALYARLLSGSPLEQLVSAPEFAA